jgi:glycine/D-amino acid oxidase-like deaminating enzyme
MNAVAPGEDRRSLPARCDVVVIGGGIIGASAALFLARKGVSVALLEKGRIGAEQSSRNWGWCRTMGRDAAEIPLAIESLRLWERLDREMDGGLGFRRCGIVYLYHSDREIAAAEAWLSAATPFQLGSRRLSAEDIAALLPGAARPFRGGLLTPGDARAEPGLAPPAIAEAARRAGAYVCENCAARGVETTAGRVGAVISERGRIDCDAIVLAGGAWSRLFCGNFGLDLPQLKVLGSVMRTAPLEGAPELSVGASDFSFRKRLDGGYTLARRNGNISSITPDSFRLFFDFLPALASDWRDLRLRVGRRFIDEWRLPRRWALDAPSPFEAVRTLDPAPAEDVLQEGESKLRTAFPVFATAQIVQRWGGLIDVTPDATPIISALDSMPGFYLATGFSGHGFGIGPASGSLIADMVAGDRPLVDPTPFRLDRFKRASRSQRTVAA